MLPTASRCLKGAQEKEEKKKKKRHDKENVSIKILPVTASSQQNDKFKNGGL